MRRVPVLLRIAAPVIAALSLSSCSWLMEKTPEDLAEEFPLVGNQVRFARAAFSELPKTYMQDWDRALEAFRISCTAMGSTPLWRDACSNAQFAEHGKSAEFFMENFEPWHVLSVEGNDTSKSTTEGLMTGYYEPMLKGSRTKGGPYVHPLHAVPDDLITVDLTSLHPQLKGLRLKGKVVGNRLVPYDERKDFAKREDLDGKVLCWVDSAVDAFFLQIQGSGRVLLPDASFMRVGYSDQNGHPYRSVGAWLIKNAGVPREEMSMQRIRRWIAENPERTDELLHTNPNVVFFEERIGYSDSDGPIGAQGVPISAGASVAVDRRFWQLGLPFVVDVRQEDTGLSFAKPVIAQDTGGAIRGPIRFDYFWGYGDAAGESAGTQKSRVSCWVLLPKGKTPLQQK